MSKSKFYLIVAGLRVRVPARVWGLFPARQEGASNA